MWLFWPEFFKVISKFFAKINGFLEDYEYDNLVLTENLMRMFIVNDIAGVYGGK